MITVIAPHADDALIGCYEILEKIDTIIYVETINDTRKIESSLFCKDHNIEPIYLNGDFKELRSFNSDGEESGLVIYSKDIMETNEDVSYYLGCVIDDVKEIHFKEDLSE